MGQLDSRLERTTDTLVSLGFWLEEDALDQDEAFAGALAWGFARFVTFLGVGKLDPSGIREPWLRKRVPALSRPNRR